jgi:peptide/nickel transport system ATP-binding protein
VDDVSFDVGEGEILGVVGESGCGKTMSMLSVMRLLPDNGRVLEGSALFRGMDIMSLSEREMCAVRGRRISLIFQDPLSALNPSMTVGYQIMEPFLIHRTLTKKEAKEAALNLMRKVGIPSPERRFSEYPHNLSGGMRQRIMIAAALSCRPSLLIADEPTTALDVSIQAQILELLLSLREDTNMAIILVTHDLGVVSEVADNVLVMYAGRDIEYGTAEEVLSRPKHPYTNGLLRSVPKLEDDVFMLDPIAGSIPRACEMPDGCRFHPRCPSAADMCRSEKPGRYPGSGNSYVSCFLYRNV